MLAPGAEAAAAPLPPGFFGVVPQGPLTSADFDRMSGSVGTLRIPLYWYAVEPQPGQLDFTALDETIGQAADHGIRVLPFVYGSPQWLTGDEATPPLRTAAARRAWSRILRVLVERYGPKGVFWRGRHRRLPIRRWQIWNEPNFTLFWHPRPAPLGYARLLKISSRVVRSADPDAVIVAAGVAPVEAGMKPWSFLRRMYEAPGALADFDVVALHPYAPYVPWVGLQIRFVRDVMRRAGDARTPLLLTELGVASGDGRSNVYAKGLQGQAAFLRRVTEMAMDGRARSRLAGIVWYAWRDLEHPDVHCLFCQHAGLMDLQGRPKPAWWAFRRLARAHLDKDLPRAR